MADSGLGVVAGVPTATLAAGVVANGQFKVYVYERNKSNNYLGLGRDVVLSVSLKY